MLSLQTKPVPIPRTKRLANTLSSTCRKMSRMPRMPSLVSIRRAMGRGEATKITLVKTIEAATRTMRVETEIKPRVKLGGAVLKIIGINLTKKEGWDLKMLAIWCLKSMRAELLPKCLPRHRRCFPILPICSRWMLPSWSHLFCHWSTSAAQASLLQVWTKVLKDQIAVEDINNSEVATHNTKWVVEVPRTEARGNETLAQTISIKISPILQTKTILKSEQVCPSLSA